MAFERDTSSCGDREGEGDLTLLPPTGLQWPLLDQIQPEAQRPESPRCQFTQLAPRTKTKPTEAVECSSFTAPPAACAMPLCWWSASTGNEASRGHGCVLPSIIPQGLALAWPREPSRLPEQTSAPFPSCARQGPCQKVFLDSQPGAEVLTLAVSYLCGALIQKVKANDRNHQYLLLQTQKCCVCTGLSG